MVREPRDHSDSSQDTKNGNTYNTEPTTKHQQNGVVIHNNKNNHRVKFVEDLEEFHNAMNQTGNITGSQPLVSNGHLVSNGADLADSQKFASSHPHVTISSHQDHAKVEDRAFRTKIDK